MKKRIIDERKEILHYIYGVLRRYTRVFIFLIIIQFLFAIGGFAEPFLYGVLIEDIILNKNINSLFWVCLAYVCIYCFDTILIVIQKNTQINLYNCIKTDIRKKIWKKYMKAPYYYFEDNNNGDLKQRIDTDTNVIENFMNEQIIVYIYNVFLMLIYACVLFVISWKLFIFSILMVPVSFWFGKRMAKNSEQAWGKYREYYGRYEGWLQNNLQNWKEIKVYNAQASQEIIFCNHWNRLKKYFYKGCLYSFVNRSFVGFSDFFITKMNIYFIGGLLVFNGDLKIGSMFVFIKFYESMFGAITNLINANVKLQEYKESLWRVIELLRKDFDEGYMPKKPLHVNKIRFEAVCFKYKNENKLILNNINFEIVNGQCLAIVGKSGAGKTTIIKLLLGLYDNYQGNIYWGDKELRDVKRVHHYVNIAGVLQDSVLYNFSILDNMRMVKKEATLEDIIHVCKEVGMHDDIEQMPNGYNTILGERGACLSGGQKQRIMIARALLFEPDVLVFDEATSALDYKSEKIIYNTLEKLKGKCMIIIIAHKLQSILLSDTVMVIEDSTIVEQGHYKDLLKYDSAFSNLFRRQYEME